MKLTFPVKILIAALLVWLLPFALSIPFYDRNGLLQTSFVLFKATMAVILLVVSYAAFRWVYRSRASVSLAQALMIGLFALAVSVVLDVLTVLPLSGMRLSDYALQIGLVYLLMLVTSVIASKQ